MHNVRTIQLIKCIYKARYIENKRFLIIRRRTLSNTYSCVYFGHLSGVMVNKLNLQTFTSARFIRPWATSKQKAS